MTFQNIIKLENFLLVLQKIKRTLGTIKLTEPVSLFKIAENQHIHHTQNATHQQITLPQVRTTNYGLNSVTHKAAKNRNSVQKSIVFNFLDDYLSATKFIKSFKENIYKKQPTSFTVTLI